MPLRGLILFAPGLELYERRLPLTAVCRFLVPLVAKQELPTQDTVDPEAFNLYWCYESYPVGGGYQLWRLQREVRSRLAEVHVPLIVFMGKQDRAVRPETARVILNRASSVDTQVIWLENSGHGIMVDAEREDVFQRCIQWIRSAVEVAVAADGVFECCARHSQPTMRHRRRGVEPPTRAVTSRGDPAG